MYGYFVALANQEGLKTCQEYRAQDRCRETLLWETVDHLPVDLKAPRDTQYTFGYLCHSALPLRFLCGSSAWPGAFEAGRFCDRTARP